MHLNNARFTHNYFDPMFVLTKFIPEWKKFLEKFILVLGGLAILPCSYEFSDKKKAMYNQSQQIFYPCQVYIPLWVRVVEYTQRILCVA